MAHRVLPIDGWSLTDGDPRRFRIRAGHQRNSVSRSWPRKARESAAAEETNFRPLSGARFPALSTITISSKLGAKW